MGKWLDLLNENSDCDNGGTFVSFGKSELTKPPCPEAAQDKDFDEKRTFVSFVSNGSTPLEPIFETLPYLTFSHIGHPEGKKQGEIEFRGTPDKTDKTDKSQKSEPRNQNSLPVEGKPKDRRTCRSPEPLNCRGWTFADLEKWKRCGACWFRNTGPNGGSDVCMLHGEQPTWKIFRKCRNFKPIPENGKLQKGE
ncbi:MAG: hypothetical protein ACLFQY_21010 [Desulfococcaceae bacterium]